MNRTSIEWVKNPDGTQGYTWNPVTGCLNTCSFCYARRLANGRLRNTYLKQRFNLAGDASDPFAPRFWFERVNGRQFSALKKPSTIFVSDMGDLFGPWVSEVVQSIVLGAADLQKQHTFIFLTKYPHSYLLIEDLIPDNCWIGTSICYRQDANRADFLRLLRKDVVKFISFEPLLEGMKGYVNFEGIDWVIVGAQTRPPVQPLMSDVEWIIQQAHAHFAPVFLKDNLNWKGIFRYQDMPKTKTPA